MKVKIKYSYAYLKIPLPQFQFFNPLQYFSYYFRYTQYIEKHANQKVFGLNM